MILLCSGSFGKRIVIVLVIYLSRACSTKMKILNCTRTAKTVKNYNYNTNIISKWKKEQSIAWWLLIVNDSYKSFLILLRIWGRSCAFRTYSINLLWPTHFLAFPKQIRSRGLVIVEAVTHMQISRALLSGPDPN